MIEEYVDTRELRRLFSTLAAVLLGLTIAGLFASLVVPGLRNANKPAIPSGVSPVTGETGWLDPSELPPRRGRVIPPVDPKSLMKPSPGLIEAGKGLFEKNCIQCHGESGRGDGSAAAALNPKPRNFTAKDGWVNGYDMPGIYRTLSEGISGTSMSPFEYLARKERMALVHYVQSLGAFSHGTGSPQALEALFGELASAGEKIPNWIPVSMAMSKLEEEFTGAPPLGVSKDDHSRGAEILRRIVVDPARAAQVLSESQIWRADEWDLAACILPDTPGNGFSVSTAALDPSEWKALHEELLKRLKRNEGGKK